MINVNAVYKNANAPIEARIKDLMSHMSVKEKLGQMTQIERAVATPDVIKDLCIGILLICKYMCACLLKYFLVYSVFLSGWIKNK